MALSVCIGLMLAGASAFSATNIFVENFEGNFPEDNGWTVSGNTNSGGACWGKVDAGFGGEAPHGGDYKGYCAANGYAGTYDNPQYLSNMNSKMSIILNLSNYNVATLTFWYKGSSASGAWLEIDLGNGRNGPMAGLGLGSSAQWRQFAYNLKSYVGGTVKIDFIFWCNQATNGLEGFYVDDIMVSADYLTGPPGAIIQQSPYWGRVGGRSFSYKWANDTNSAPCEWYRLYVARNGQVVEDFWTTNSVDYADQSKYPAGDYTWWVQGWNRWGFSPWSGPVLFRVQTNFPGVPTVMQPTNGSVLDSPYVTYQCSYLDALWYEFCIYKDGALFADVWTNDYYLSLNGHGKGEYSCWVRGWNPDGMGPWSQAGHFSVSLQAPGVMEHLYPFGKRTLSATAPYVEWVGADNADWYCLDINCNGTNYLTKWFQNNNQSWYQLSNALPAGSYSWRIAGWNSEGMGPWSTNCNLTVLADGTPYYPVQRTNSYAGCYYWYPGIDSSWYELYVNKDGGLFFHQWLSTNSLSGGAMWGYWRTCLTNDHPAGNYSWWVRPWSPTTGLGEWSSTANFTVAPTRVAPPPPPPGMSVGSSRESLSSATPPLPGMPVDE